MTTHTAATRKQRSTQSSSINRRRDPWFKTSTDRDQKRYSRLGATILRSWPQEPILYMNCLFRVSCQMGPPNGRINLTQGRMMRDRRLTVLDYVNEESTPSRGGCA